MSKSDNQSRKDQYGVIEPTLPKPKLAYNQGTGKGALSDGAGKDPRSSNYRGPQGNG